MSQTKESITHKNFDQSPQMYGSIKEKKVHPDLLEERKNLDFNQEELTKLIYGTEFENHRKYLQWLNKNLKEFPGSRIYEMTREEQMEHILRIAALIRKSKEIYDEEMQSEGYTTLFNLFDYLQTQMPNTISLSMFNKTLRNLGSPEQVAYWAKRTGEMSLLGCYVQTELGHGSNVVGLETTATLDKQTDEWVIDSPTQTSIKYWPGELSKMSTHAMVACRLRIDGEDYGVQFLVVQLRCSKTHEVLPGLEIGDIGPKFGYNSKDNGYLIFKNHRIPRTNLLMRYCKVDKDGKVSLEGDPRILYATMMFIRQWIICGAWKEQGAACLIASRYAAVRRQFSTVENNKKQERKLLDYQAHQLKIIPVLAQVFAFNLSRNYITEYYLQFLNHINSGSQDFKPLQVIHHFTSGLKAFFTSNAYEAINKMREACGGAGFSQYSALPLMLQDYGAKVAFEGDNIVMLQQSAKYIIDRLAKGKKFEGAFLEYLNNLESTFSQLPTKVTSKDLKCPDSVEEALKIRSAYFIYTQIVQKFSKEQDKASYKVLMNEMYQQDQIILTNYHLAYYTYWAARRHIQNSQIKDQNLFKHINSLICVYGLNELLKDSTMLYDCGYFSNQHRSMILETLKSEFQELRPHIIPIVESFEIPDVTINSSIGNSYGDIYEGQLDSARNGQLNKQNMIKGFSEHILPIIQGKL